MPETFEEETERLEDEAREEDLAAQDDEQTAKDLEAKGDKAAAATWRQFAKQEYERAAKKYEDAGLRRVIQARLADRNGDVCKAGEEYRKAAQDYKNASRARRAAGDAIDADRLQEIAKQLFEKAGDRLKECAEQLIEEGKLGRRTVTRLQLAEDSFKQAGKDGKAAECHRLLKLVGKVLQNISQKVAVQEPDDLLEKARAAHVADRAIEALAALVTSLRFSPRDLLPAAPKEECHCEVISVDGEVDKKTGWQCRCFKLANPNRRLSSFKGPGFTNWVSGTNSGLSAAGNITEQIVDAVTGEAFVVEYKCKCQEEA